MSPFEALAKPHIMGPFSFPTALAILLTDLNATWNQVTSATNLSTGKFTNSATSTNYQVGSFTASQMKYIEPGAMIKFEAPAGFHFMGNDNNKYKYY